MSYVSGIGGQQQGINSATPSEVKPKTGAVGSGDVVNISRELTAAVEHADQTNLSATGGLVAHAMESSDTRSAKVQSLQQAIATGSYSVSPADVADKIIQSLLG